VITYAVIISIVTILIRIIWVYPGTYLPRILFKSIREKEVRPSWQPVFYRGMEWYARGGFARFGIGNTMLMLNGNPHFLTGI
jgi:hypothetical protein